MDTWPLAALTISLGMVKAETLSGPLCSSRSTWVSISLQSADARSQDHAAAKRIFLGEVDAAVAHGVDAGDHGELREAVDALGFVGRDVAVGRSSRARRRRTAPCLGRCRTDGSRECRFRP